MATCNKSSCNHCEEIFDSKNKLHNHIRNHECQKLLFSKSEIAIKTALTKLSTPEKNAISDENTAQKRITYPAATSSSAAKSISPHKFNLSTLAPVESIALNVTILTKLSLSSANPSPTYQAISSPPPTYKPYKKPYLTIADLYMRYAPLSKPSSNKITRTMTVLPAMSMQDPYFPTKQHATRQNLGHAVFERFESIRCPKKKKKKKKCVQTSFFDITKVDCPGTYCSTTTSYQVYQAWRPSWYMHR